MDRRITPVPYSNHPTTSGGSSGSSAIDLLSNFLTIAPKPSSVIYDYRVDFIPPVPNFRLRKGLLYAHKDQLGVCTYDGNFNLKSLKRLDETNTKLQCTVQRTNENHELVVTYTGEVDPNSTEMVRLMSILHRENLSSMGLVKIRRDNFDIDAGKEIPEHRLTIWPGFRSRVSLLDHGAGIQIDSVSKFVRSDTAVKILQILRSQRDFANAARREFCGKLVMTRYNNKIYRVTDVLLDPMINPLKSFMKSGTEITIKAYYSQYYNLEIKDDGQPLFQAETVGQRRNQQPPLDVDNPSQPALWLVPELCILLGAPDSTMSDPATKRNILRHIRLSPQERLDMLKRHILNLNNHQEVKSKMDEWELSYGIGPTRVTGHLLGKEKIIFGHNQVDQPQLGNFNVRLKTFYSLRTPQIKLAVVAPMSMSRRASEIISKLKQVGAELEIHFLERIFAVHGDRTQDYITSLSSMTSLTETAPPDLVVVILRGENATLYQAAKKRLTCDTPILSQFIRDDKLKNPTQFHSIVHKIVTQIAVKTGARPWRVELPPALSRSLIFGFAGCNDTTLMEEGVVGMVCSTDSEFASWTSRAKFYQKSDRMAMASHIAQFIADCCQRYKGRVGQFPYQLIIYRNAVSEGEVDDIRTRETNLIEVALNEIGIAAISPVGREESDSEGESDESDRAASSSLPPAKRLPANCHRVKFSYLLVNKHSNTRLFKNSPQGAVNPDPGTVVDSEIVQAGSFYLNTHATTQGTARPTEYELLHETSGLTMRNHEMLANKLSHMYYNWAGQIRIPSPIMYAHKLASLCGETLHREPDQRLCDNLFFI